MNNLPQKIGKYTIVERIGRGGMGYVYRALDPILKRDVALKTMLKDVADDAELRSRFLREAQSAGGLRHPNIVTIYDLGEDDAGIPYIAMEFLTGTDLEHIIKKHMELPLEKKLEIIIQTCSGLGFAHTRGIVHRDIKPGNIRLLDNGEVKIMDFGIAKITASQFTRTGMIMGTPHYMAPEQIRGEKVDGRADIFSLGVVLYELLAYRKPYPGDNPTSVLFRIIHSDPDALADGTFRPPDGLEQVVLRALAKKQNERYQSCEDFNTDLLAIYNSLPKQGSQQTDARTPLPFSPFSMNRTPTPMRSSPAPPEAPTILTPPPVPLSQSPAASIPRAAAPATAVQSPTHATVRKPQAQPLRQQVSPETDLPPVSPTEVPSSLRRWILLASSGVLSIVLIIVLATMIYKRFTSPNPQPAVVDQPATPAVPDKPPAATQSPAITKQESTPAPAVAEGWLSLNILPWAEIQELKNEKGELITPGSLVTPCRLQLPPGKYSITLNNSRFKSLTLEVEIKSEETTIVNRRLEGFDYGRAADSIKF